MKHFLTLILLSMLANTQALAELNSDAEGGKDQGSAGRPQKIKKKTVAKDPFDCTDSGSTYCQAQFEKNHFERADKELNERYGALLNRLNDDRALIAKLKEAQRAWIIYRDKVCAFENEFGGGIESISWIRCKARITQQRLDDLKGGANDDPV